VAVPKARYQLGGAIFHDLLLAILSLDPGEEPRSRQRWKMAALEATVLAYPDAVEVACNQVRARMQELSIKGVNVRSLIREARQIAGKVGAAKPEALTR